MSTTTAVTSEREKERESQHVWVGKPLKRKEDPRLLTGHGQFVDDMKFFGALHAHFVRSPYAHARIKSIDTSKAESLPGVELVLTGKQVQEMIRPIKQLFDSPPYYPIAVDKTRFVGEPVAVIAAISKSIAEDAAELVEVEYEPLTVVVDAEKAMNETNAPILHEEFGSNIGWHGTFEYGDVEEAFKKAELKLSDRFYFNRYASTPIEPTACVSKYESSTGILTIWDHNQQAGMYHARLASTLKLPEHKLRHVTLDIGGGFGNKIMVYGSSILVSCLSMKTGKPVKWFADRREDLTALMQSPDRVYYVDAAFNKNGEVLGFKVKLIDNFGAFVRHPDPQNVTKPFMTFLGAYKIRNVAIDAYGVLTNKCPSGPNRGFGTQHTYYFLELMMEKIAHALEMDSVELREKNMIGPSQMPYTTPFGCVYDGGDYPECFSRCLNSVGYSNLRKEQKRLREKGRYIGISVVPIVEPGATNSAVVGLWGGKTQALHSSTTEAASIKLMATGKAIVALGTVPQGQGHETVVSQLVADELGLTPDDVDVLTGFDSFTHPYGGESGTYASRFAVTGVGAVLGAARKIKSKMLEIASSQLGVGKESLRIADGNIYDVDNPKLKKTSIKEITRIAYNHLALLPPGMDPGLQEVYTYHFPYTGPIDDKMRANFSASYAYSSSALAIEVDIETGKIKLLKFVTVHDGGTILNPMILDGQVHGCVLHGLAGAIFEEFKYSEDGQPLAPTFMDYLAPTAMEMIDFQVEHMETPSPFTPNGAKGSGEGGAMPTPAMVALAVQDALEPFGVVVRDLPMSPENVWKLIQRGRGPSSPPTR